MPGQSDFSAMALLNDLTAALTYPGTTAPRWLALFSAAPLNDAGTGGTELSGAGYARVQFSGTMLAGAAWIAGATTITLTATAPAWLLALGTTLTPGYGCNIYSGSRPTGTGQIGTIQSVSGTTITLQTGALQASQTVNDNLYISAFPLASNSVGAEPAPITPASVTNGAQINFAQATGIGGWGTAVSWAIYDALINGNMKFFDYLGNFPWLPVSCSAASPGVITAPRHGFPAAQPIAISAKPGGSLPTFTQSNFTNNLGTMITTGITTDTLQATNAGTAVNTSTTGDFMLRGVGLQPIPQNVTAQFPASSFVIFAA